MKRRKNFVRALFILVGMAIGYYYLPPLWVTLGIKLHSPLVMIIVNVAIGAIIFGLLSLSLTDWVLRVGKRIEHNLAQKSPLYLIMGGDYHHFGTDFGRPDFHSALAVANSGAQ